MACDIHLGDCADLLPRLGIQPQLILTSPPYGAMRDFGGHGFDFDRVADALVASMPEGGVLVWVTQDETIDGSETGESFRQALGFMARGLRLHDTMIYLKAGTPPKANTVRYRNMFEYMLVLSLDRPRVVNLIRDQPALAFFENARTATRRMPDGSLKPIRASNDQPFIVRDNAWRIKAGNANAAESPVAHEHPAIFPLALAKDHIRTWTNPGDLVLDPMAGSGTTLRAAVDLHRQAVGIEIHEPYVDLIRRRMQQQVLSLTA